MWIYEWRTTLLTVLIILVYWAPTAMHLESSPQLVYRYVNLRGYSNTNHPLFYFLCMQEITKNKEQVP